MIPRVPATISLMKKPAAAGLWTRTVCNRVWCFSESWLARSLQFISFRFRPNLQTTTISQPGDGEIPFLHAVCLDHSPWDSKHSLNVFRSRPNSLFSPNINSSFDDCFLVTTRSYFAQNMSARVCSEIPLITWHLFTSFGGKPATPQNNRNCWLKCPVPRDRVPARNTEKANRKLWF